jgi:hypothetical protein
MPSGGLPAEGRAVHGNEKGAFLQHRLWAARLARQKERVRRMTIHQQGYPNSSNIRELSYDDEALRLYAEFRSGQVYSYQPVQIDVWNTLHATTTGIGGVFQSLIVKQASKENAVEQKRYTYRKEAALEHEEGKAQSDGSQGAIDNADGGGNPDRRGPGIGRDDNPAARGPSGGPAERPVRLARPALGTRRPPTARDGE